MPPPRNEEFREAVEVIRPWLESQAEEALRRIVSPGFPPTETEFERGRLAALRALLDSAAPPAEQQFPSSPDYLA